MKLTASVIGLLTAMGMSVLTSAAIAAPLSASALVPARCARATGSCAVRGESFAHDPLYRSCTAPASYGAAEASIDLLCTERLLPHFRYDVPNVVVTQYVA